MPDALEREVIFDIAPALEALQDLDREFERSSRQLTESLAEAAQEGLSDIRIEDVDAAPVAEAIVGAVEEGTATPAVVDADATAVEGSVTTAIVEGSSEPAVVEGDATNVSDEIENAIASADDLVVVEGDASNVSDEIENAISSVDSTVSVDADTTAAEGSIAQLSDQAINVDVETNAAEAAGEVDTLSSSTQEATASTEGLSTANTVLSGAVATSVGNTKNLGQIAKGLGPEFGAASVAIGTFGAFIGVTTAQAIEAETATRRFTQQLGAFASEVEEINIGGLNTNISDLALLLGSSDDAMRASAASLAQFGRSAGASEKDIAGTAEQVLVLAARAVALDPTLGDVGAAADRLRAALTSGRDRALIPFGISLDKAAVAAKAQEIALAAGRQEVSAYDKLAAAAAITTAKFGDSIGKDIAEGAQTSEIRLRSLRTALSEALEEAGRPLVSPLIDVIEKATPIAIALAEALSGLAEGALPVLGSALDLIGPPLDLLAAILGAIPEPIVTISAAFGLLLPLLGAIQAAIVQVGIAAGASSITLATMAGPISLAVVAISALTLAFVSFGKGSRDAAAETKAMGEALFGTAESATDLKGKFDVLNDSFEDYIKNTADFGEESETIAEAQKNLGITNEQLFEALRGGQEEFDKFGAAIHNASLEIGNYKTNGQDVREELRQEREQLKESSKATFEFAVASGAISEAVAKQAKELNKVKGEGVDYVGALEDAANAQVELEEKQKQVTIQTATQGEAFAALRQKVIAGLDVSGELDDFASDFGLTAEDVKGELDELAQTTSQFVSTALSGLPTGVQAIGEFAADIAAAQDAVATQSEQSNERIAEAYRGVVTGVEGSKEELKAALADGAAGAEEAQGALLAALDPQRIIDKLNEQRQAILDFNENLRKLLDANALAVIDAVLKAGDAGPILAERLAAAAPEVLAAANTAFAGVPAAAEATEPLVIEFLQRVEAAAGAGGTAAGTAYAAGFQIAPATEEELAAAEAAIIAANPKITSAAAASAVAADQAFAARFAPAVPAGVSMDAAGNVIGARAPVGPAGKAGTDTTTAYGKGLNIPGETGNQFVNAAGRITVEQANVASSARAAGLIIGKDFAVGVQLGIQNNAGLAASAASRLVRDAEAAARREAASQSPSRLFMELGADMGEGLVIGIEQSTKAVQRASANLANASVSGFTGLSAPAPAGRVIAATGGASGGGTVTNNNTFDVAVTVNGPLTQTEARAVGVQIADSAAAQLRRRDVIARVRAAV